MKITIDWLNLIIGAFLGWALPNLFKKGRDLSRIMFLWIIKQMEGKVKVDIKKKTLSLLAPQYSLKLYNDTSIKTKNNSICLLTKDEWLFDKVISPYEECFVNMADDDKLAEKMAEKVADKQTDKEVKSNNSNFFNGSICVIQSPLDNLTSIWKLTNCEYYTYARFKRKVLLSQHIPNFLLFGNVRAWLNDPLKVIAEKREAIAIGASVALVQDKEDGRKEILLNLRSKDVFVEPNMWSVLPCFGVETNIRMGHKSKFEILQYNFIRELGEELFGIPELIHPNGKYDPNWFVKHENIRMVIDDWDAEKFSLHLLGISIDPWNPSVHFSFMAYSKELNFWTKYCKDGTCWEIADNWQGEPIMRFFDLSEDLLEPSKEKPKTETSRFLISRILNVMKTPPSHN